MLGTQIPSIQRFGAFYNKFTYGTESGEASWKTLITKFRGGQEDAYGVSRQSASLVSQYNNLILSTPGGARI